MYKKFKIVILSAEDIDKSNQIIASDSVLAARRIVDNDNYGNTEYNIYTIQKDSDDNNDMYNATHYRANKDGWHAPN